MANLALNGQNSSLTSGNVTLEKKWKEAKNQVKKLTDQLEKISNKMAGRHNRDEPTDNRSEFPQLGGNNSQLVQSHGEAMEDGEMSNLNAVIMNNPKRAKEMMLKYKQEINFLRSQLQSLQDR